MKHHPLFQGISLFSRVQSISREANDYFKVRRSEKERASTWSRMIWLVMGVRLVNDLARKKYPKRQVSTPGVGLGTGSVNLWDRHTLDLFKQSPSIRSRRSSAKVIPSQIKRASCQYSQAIHRSAAVKETYRYLPFFLHRQ